MNKIFTSKQIAAIDDFTIKNEPIADIDLMERASLQIANWLIRHISNERELYFFVGPGNNGGDALAVARMMADFNYVCRLYILDFGQLLKGSPAINEKRLREQGKVSIVSLRAGEDFPEIPANALIVDGLFGSGLNRPLEGLVAKLVEYLNDAPAQILAIDIPSGLFGEDNSTNDLDKVIHADFTLTFQFPKLSFFFPEHEQILGNWEVLSIGLHPNSIEETETPYYFLSAECISGKLKGRSRFSHKGTYGHALLIAGAYGKMGAAVLASKSCLRSGTGLLTAHVPHSGAPIIQTAVPEAMCSIDASDLMFTEFPKLDQFSAVGAGPGIGTKSNSQRALKELLSAKPSALVLDADALNILSMHQDWYDLLPENTVLTPHPKEFERLVGPFTDSFIRLQLQREFSQKYKVVIILKGAFTTISFPDGRVCFNTTGNPGMATAGSGDVLTGIVLGLMAQRYSAEDAAVLAVFLHGLAADIAIKSVGQEALISGDITENLGLAFLEIRNSMVV